MTREFLAAENKHFEKSDVGKTMIGLQRAALNMVTCETGSFHAFLTM